MELDPAEKNPGFARRLVTRTSSLLDATSEGVANWMNRWMPHPSTEEPDAYTLKMEQIHNQGCDPVTGANHLTWEAMASMAPLPSSGLTGTEYNPLPPHEMPTY